MSGTVNSEKLQELEELKAQAKESLQEYKDQSREDLEIDDASPDQELFNIPNLFSKYNEYYVDETIRLKELYSFKERVRMERWKYWMGKQTDKYYAENGLVHDKIMKGDIDKYMAADEKLIAVNDIVSIQKAIVDFLERIMKEIGGRNWEIKTAVDWRKFVSGA